MSDQLLAATIELLESGDDEGCDGLVIVTADAYVLLQQVVRAQTGFVFGVSIEH